MEETKNDFYVYKWYNMDTNEVFYVGKGHRDRYKSLSHRNQYFLDYVKNNHVSNQIVKDNLTEEEAFLEEEKLTNYYKQMGQCQCCLAKAGTGGISSAWTDEFKQYWSEHNPMKDEKQRERMRNNNPMKNPEVAEKVRLKTSIPVIIGEKEFPSPRDAGEYYGVRKETIYSWCKRGYSKDGKPCYYTTTGPKEYTIPPKGKPVLIDGIYYYGSIKEAASLFFKDNDSSPLCKALQTNHFYKGHKCEYANQQPSQ